MATAEAIDVVMPQMGVSVSEGTITKWLKQQGEQVEADEPLLEISTDKVDTEVPSPGEGVVAKIMVQEGETVEVGTVLAVIAPEGAEVSTPAPAEAPPATDVPALSPAAERFKTCRWRATPEDGDFCTHRDVLPFAGKEGFKPDSWCPECAFYKLRRTPKKRERSDYSY